jgi:hypothetical protein
MAPAAAWRFERAPMRHFFVNIRGKGSLLPFDPWIVLAWVKKTA